MNNHKFDQIDGTEYNLLMDKVEKYINKWISKHSYGELPTFKIICHRFNLRNWQLHQICQDALFTVNIGAGNRGGHYENKYQGDWTVEIC
jgi:hypothetical protein